MASVIHDAKEIIALAAGPRQWSDSVKAYINRGARRLGITPGRATSIWYAKVNDLRVSEWLHLQRKAAELRAAQQEQRDNNNEFDAELQARRGMAVAEQRGPDVLAMVRTSGEESSGQGASAAVQGQITTQGE